MKPLSWALTFSKVFVLILICIQGGFNGLEAIAIVLICDFLDTVALVLRRQETIRLLKRADEFWS